MELEMPLLVSKMELLKVRNLFVNYKSYWYTYHVLNGVTLSITSGEKIGLIGESGSGKTTLLKSILKILPPQGKIVAGDIFYKEKNIIKMKKEELDHIRRNYVGMIFQDPLAALNPVFKIKDQIIEILKHSENSSETFDKKELIERATGLLKEVALPEPERVLESYPFQLSGGMRQRVIIAMALASAKELLLADEPTTNLDVTIQDQILRLINNLVRKRNLSLILVSHALGMISRMTDRTYVIYAGDIVEEAPTKDLFKEPLHPYTQLLLQNAPRISGKGIGEGIKGNPPDYRNPPRGCRFHTRCPFVMEICKKEKPQPIIINNRTVACYIYNEKKK
jgi:peptide/nickel transport system ATP-binding protein